MDVLVTGIQQGRGAGKGNHCKSAAGLGQQLRNTRQVLMIPLGGNELDDGVFRLLQPRTRLADNQAMDLPDIGGWEVTVLANMLS